MNDSQPAKMEVFATPLAEGVSGVVAQGRMGSISAQSETQQARVFKYIQAFKREKWLRFVFGALFRIFRFSRASHVRIARNDE
jgi:hypothetical protein